jgi:hypothetical protein
MAYDAAKYDIAGSFSRGREGTLKAKRARQRIKSADIKIKNESDSLESRRRTQQRDRGRSGMPPLEFENYDTDMRGPVKRTLDWIKERSANKISPDAPGEANSTQYAEEYKLGTRYQMAQTAAKSKEAQMQGQEDEMLAERYATEEFEQAEIPQYANGGRAIPSTSPSVNSYADGGAVDDGGQPVQHEEHRPGVFTVGAQRDAPLNSVVPQMADGGILQMAGGGVVASERTLSAAERLNQYEKAKNAPRPSQALSPQQNLEARGGVRGNVSKGRGFLNSRAARIPTSAIGRGLRHGARFGVGALAYGAAETAVESYGTGTDEYRERYGIPESPNDGWRRTVDDLAVRGKGFLEDFGNKITGGVAGDIGSGMNAPDTAIPPELPSSVPPVSEDEKVGQDAKGDAERMAAEAEAANKPPGEIDFSKVDFKSGDFPSMTVKDWTAYRYATVADLVGMGVGYEDAHDQVSNTQQKEFLNYLKQGQMHLEVGNAPAAAGALRMAFQHFPNGSDVKIGVHQDPNTGQPILLGMGMNDETGEPVGQPQFMDAQKLGMMIDNFGNPASFRMWTKDRDDNTFRDKGQKIEQQRADQMGRYQEKMGTAALGRASAAIQAAANSLDGIEDVAEATKRIREELSISGIEYDDQVKLLSIMGQIKQNDPGLIYPEIYQLVVSQYKADPEQLDEMLDSIGIR